MTGREPARDVKARYSCYQAPSICECVPCQLAAVDGPPVFVPDGWDTLPDGSRVEMGRWLHGIPLRRHWAAARGIKARVERAMQATMWPGVA